MKLVFLSQIYIVTCLKRLYELIHNNTFTMLQNKHKTHDSLTSVEDIVLKTRN